MSPAVVPAAAVVRVRHLRKDYGDTVAVAVADISFDVRAGDIFGPLGPNGSGKTTTVECRQCLRVADGEHLDVLGLDPRTEAGRVRRVLGSQLQDSALPERPKVWEALRLFSTLTPPGPSWEHPLAEWGLADRRNAAFGDLSDAQQQRPVVDAAARPVAGTGWDAGAVAATVGVLARQRGRDHVARAARAAGTDRAGQPRVLDRERSGRCRR